MKCLVSENSPKILFEIREQFQLIYRTQLFSSRPKVELHREPNKLNKNEKSGKRFSIQFLNNS